MKQPYTKTEYSNYVNKKSPNSPLGKILLGHLLLGELYV